MLIKLNKNVMKQFPDSRTLKDVSSLYFDSVSLLLRAPKLILINIDRIFSVMDQDKVFLNAFGKVHDLISFNEIPYEHRHLLDVCNSNNIFLSHMISELQSKNP